MVAAAAPEVARTGLREWSIGTLPRTIEQVRAGYAVTAYPALVDEGATVGVKVFDSPAEAEAAHWAGTRRLLRLTVPSPARFLQGRLSNEAKLALSRNPHGGVQELIEDAAGRGHRPADRRRGRAGLGRRRASPRCARRSAPTWSTPWSR